MSKIKVRAGGQVKIPDLIVSKYRLKEGHILNVRDVNGAIVFIPEKIKKNKKHLSDLNKRIWDRLEEEASEAIARGEIIGPFDNLDEALKALKTSRV